MPTLMAAATFRIGLIMERGLMRQRISPGSGYAGLRRWDGRCDDAGHGAGGRVDLKLGHYAKDGIEVIDVQGEIDMYTAPRLRELLIDLVSKGQLPARRQPGQGRVPRLHRPRGAGRGPEAGAGPRRLAGSGLHAAADPEDLPDHGADRGLRHLRDGGPGHRGEAGPPVRNASPGRSSRGLRGYRQGGTVTPGL